ncbi:MAG: trypsin-like peptidase domain-containing protein [Ignavibacteriae bacterium]|nr:trypsin-like peptidase domain-containing protein [Ignavibacteriota bacterium]MCB0724101.1 trypsin-like peptidase domain-containing protein [Ignavibacteriota bacterium]MCB9243855.1 trypsin-like peptidase domain-containing protein [Ignavibacteriales bacterium]
MRILILVVLGLVFALQAYGQNGDNGKKTVLTDDPLNAEQIIERNKQSLVSIWFHTDDYFSYYTYSYGVDTTILNGSGFIVSEDGIVATNYHVVESIDSIIVKTSDGTFYDADLLLVDESNDFAILKIRNPENRAFQPVKLGDSDNLVVGQNIFAIGSPLGFEYTISEGIIAAIRDEEKVSFTDPNTYMPVEKVFDKVIQITAAISPGNSGGALFNAKGEVIGVTTYSYGFYGNLNFASAINSFKKLWTSVDFSQLENDEEAKIKMEDNQFKTSYKLASNYKSKLYYNWFYTKLVDTMTVYDTMAVRQDSLNQINLVKAQTYYDKCIDLRPDSFYVYQGLMDLYVFTDHFTEAEELYKTIRERFNSDSLLNTLSSSLADAYSSSKDYDKALTFYKKMLDQDTNDAFIYYQIADLYEKKNDNKSAITNLNMAIKYDSSYTQAYVKLGEIYYKRKDYSRAKKILEESTEKYILAYGSSPYNLDLHYYLGMIAVREGRKFDAILAYIEMKNVYTYEKDDNEKKQKLYKAIKELDE